MKGTLLYTSFDARRSRPSWPISASVVILVVTVHSRGPGESRILTCLRRGPLNPPSPVQSSSR